MFYHIGDWSGQHFNFDVILDVGIKVQFIGIVPVEFNVIIVVWEEFVMRERGAES